MSAVSRPISQRNSGAAVGDAIVNSRSTTRCGVPSESAASSSIRAIRVPVRAAAPSKPVAQGAPGSSNHGAALLSPPPTV